jgi:hypothetical protein
MKNKPGFGCSAAEDKISAHLNPAILWNFFVPEIEYYCIIIPKCNDTHYTVQLLDSYSIRVTTTATLNSQTLEGMATLLQNHQATLKIRAPPLIKTSEIKVEHELADATQDSVKELHGFILVMFPLKKKVVIKK